MNGFWVATADLTGARIAGSELLLSPGPYDADYPQESAGERVAVPDGAPVHQQPSVDGRQRTWMWKDYPATQVGYMRVWPVLEGLRSRYRKEAGLSPYVWLKEDVSGGLRRRQSLAVTASASGFTCTVSGGGLTAGALIGGSVTVAGQVRAVLANTTSVITVGDAFVGSPSGATVVLYAPADWFRARVLEVSRRVIPGKRTQYENSRIVFVIDDPNSVDLIG